jgi:phenylpyruvate tautomerase PptA (4-oxalocrotonate tautomerase family)
MPYLQLEVTKSYAPIIKQQLAKRMGKIYSTIMQADVRRVTICIRELGEGSIWRCTEDEPTVGALLMLDIRKGRSAEVRTELAKALIEVCRETLGLDAYELNVEFTQHTGDEMYHSRFGGLSKDWSADEGNID